MAYLRCRKPFPQQVAQKCKNQGEIVRQTKKAAHTHQQIHNIASERETKETNLKIIYGYLLNYKWTKLYRMFLYLHHECECSLYVSMQWPQKWTIVRLDAELMNKKTTNTQENDNIFRSLLSRVQCKQYAWKTELIEWKPARRSCRSHQFVECLNIIYHYSIYRFEYSCGRANVFSVIMEIFDKQCAINTKMNFRYECQNYQKSI